MKRVNHELIRSLWGEGYTARQIALKVGCHKNTVWLVVKDLPGGRPRELTIDRINEVLGLVRERLKDNIQRARYIRTYCEWTAKDVVKDLFEEYQHLRRLKKAYLKRKGS